MIFYFKQPFSYCVMVSLMKHTEKHPVEINKAIRDFIAGTVPHLVHFTINCQQQAISRNIGGQSPAVTHTLPADTAPANFAQTALLRRFQGDQIGWQTAKAVLYWLVSNQ